jgi:hypothetical protein
MKRIWIVAAALAGNLVTSAAWAQAGGGVQEHVAALKNSMIASQQDLRTYQWVETTTVLVKGEQKSYKEESCYYGADGSLQKVPIASSAPPKKKFGLRGAIQESKMEEMTDTMKQAAALVKSYVPPNPALLDQAVKTGNVTVDMLQPGQVVRLNFKNYKLPGDVFSITLNVQTNKLLGMSVSTYLGDPSKPVSMVAQMGTLMDGATYTARTELEVPALNIEVDVVNTGYRKMM